MKLIQISDLHLVTPGQVLMGSNPLQRLDACLASVTASHGDADLVIMTGDLSETGEAGTYAALRERLAHFTLPVRLLPGNHDSRSAFAQAFPTQVDADGFAHAAIDISENRVIALDTLHEGQVGGLLCSRRLNWLERELATAAGRPVYIFMHHPAGPVHMPALDPLGLAEPDAFFALLKRHGDVRHIFAGHLHRLVNGLWRGIPFSILRSTNHQTALDLVSPHTTPSYEAPAYAIIEARGENLVIHHQEF